MKLGLGLGIGAGGPLAVRTLSWSASGAGWVDTSRSLAGADFEYRSGAASVVVYTDAATIDVGVISEVSASFSGTIPQAVQVMIECDGMSPQTATVDTDGVRKVATITLPGSGFREVRLTDGPTSSLGTTPLPAWKGTRVTDVTVPVGSRVSLRAQAAPARRLVFFHDSRVGGGNVTATLQRVSVAAGIKHTGTWAVTLVGYGFDSYADWAGHETAVATEIAACFDGTVANVLWTDLGVNDWLLNRQSLVSLQAQVTTWCLAMAAAIALRGVSVTVYVSTPGPVNPDSTNAGGFTCAQVRTAIAAGVAAAGVGFTVVDGTTLGVTTGMVLGDTVHFTDQGHGVWANGILNTIGPAATPFSVGPGSVGNTLKSAPGAGLMDIGVGESFVLVWYQIAAAIAGTDCPLSYATGSFGSGTGWAITQDAGSTYFLPIGAGQQLFTIGGAAGIGFHAAAFTRVDATHVRKCSNGGPVNLVPGSVSAASSSAVLEIGGWGVASEYGTRMVPCGFAKFARVLDDAELVRLTAMARYGRVMWSWPWETQPRAWSAELNGLGPTSGPSPVAFIKTGTFPGPTAR